MINLGIAWHQNVSHFDLSSILRRAICTRFFDNIGTALQHGVGFHFGRTLEQQPSLKPVSF